MKLDVAFIEILQPLLASACGARRVTVDETSKLSGGAIQENWLLVARVEGGPAQGAAHWVLRKDAAAVVSSSWTRLQEAALLHTACEAGVAAPRPLLVDDGAALGFPFFVMQRLEGLAQGHRLTREQALVPDRAALVRDIGTQLARLHAIVPPQPGLAFLGAPPKDALAARINSLRVQIDELGAMQPALEFGLRWCERHAPAPMAPVLVHGDWRTGNLMIHEGRLSGVLDWEFAGWGDPREDIGWFAARCWRFARPDLTAGGLGELVDLLDAYANAGGMTLVRDDIRFWEVLAHLRWAVIALQQEHRHRSGQQRSLELALTGRLVPGLLLGALNDIGVCT